MNTAIQITFSTAGTISLPDLTYVIIGARENENWIFVRHRDRSTWELPAGHIEEGESAEDAAERELFEETGTIRSGIMALSDYSVKSDGVVSHGRIFFAEIIERGPLPLSEIAEICISRVSPESVTYPEPHRSFMKLLEKFIAGSV